MKHKVLKISAIIILIIIAVVGLFSFLDFGQYIINRFKSEKEFNKINTSYTDKNKTPNTKTFSDDFCWNKSLTNFYKIKEYFAQTKNTASYFISSENSSVSEKPFKSKVIEHLVMFGHNFEYSITRGSYTFSFKCNPDSFEVTQDSCEILYVTNKCKYLRQTKDLFTKPEFQKTDAISRETSININRPSIEYNRKLPYRIYFEIYKNDLILNKEFAIKGSLEESFYYSRERGLYKITINGGTIIETKI
jgi:hypothetical protein